MMLCNALRLWHREELFEPERDGSKRLYHFLLVQPHTSVFDRDRLCFPVRCYLDAQLPVVVVHPQQAVACTSPFQCIGRVANQFADEHFFVCVQGVDHYVQELAGLCTELERFCFSKPVLAETTPNDRALPSPTPPAQLESVSTAPPQRGAIVRTALHVEVHLRGPWPLCHTFNNPRESIILPTLRNDKNADLKLLFHQ